MSKTASVQKKYNVNTQKKNLIAKEKLTVFYTKGNA
jgi:hypothetical protein